MNEVHGRDLDLNLLRVFMVVASAGSVTRAAAQLYLTQPAVSAAMRRLATAVGAPLFARSGRGLVLTPRGEQLFADVLPHLSAMIDAALSPPELDLGSSTRTLKLGLSDAMEGWLLPRLLHAFEELAPRMRVVSLPVQFRTVSKALADRAIDLAVTVADELPTSVRRQTLFHGRFVCLFDPRRARLPRRLTKHDYFAREHVVVSYNGDLRGIVEDMLHEQRRVRCSVSSFSLVGAVVSGSALLATVPMVVARHTLELYPELETRTLPFALEGTAMEMLWPAAGDQDPASAFLREQVGRLCRELARGKL